jgi:hypothetical protein
MDARLGGSRSQVGGGAYTTREMRDHAAHFNGRPPKVKADHRGQMNLHKARGVWTSSSCFGRAGK